MSNDQFKVDFGCTLDARPIADCLDNKFYVIPSYQRGFKWGPSQVNTLLKEIVTYYNRCLSHESDNAPARVNAKFIGTIITVEMPDDAKRKMVEYTIAVPPNLRHVIDGQQRLTVLTLVTICFLRRFELLWKKFDENIFPISASAMQKISQIGTVNSLKHHSLSTFRIVSASTVPHRAFLLV